MDKINEARNSLNGHIRHFREAFDLRNTAQTLEIDYQIIAVKEFKYRFKKE